MRILHVNKFLFRAGGADAYAQDVAGLQRDRGDDVEFFAMAHPDNLPSRYAEHFPSTVSFDPPPPSLTGKVRTGARMLWSTSAASGMRRVLDDFRPDVAHLHGIYHQLSPSILRPLARRGIPTVMTLHDYKLACPTYRFLDKGVICEACMDRKFRHAAQRRCRDGSFVSSAMMGTELALHTRLGAYRPVDLFLSPSRFLMGKMTEAGVFPDRLRHLPLFSENTSTEPKRGTGGPVMFAGRLAHEKGVDVLLQAAVALGGEAETVIVGDGPERATLEASVPPELRTRIRFLGRRTKPEVQDLLRTALVAVLPARWYENQPLAILEALGTGVPVVASRLGGIPELIRDGVDGYTVPPDDPDALTAALRALLRDPARAADMGAEGRRRVTVEFAPDLHLERLDALYAEAASRAASD